MTIPDLNELAGLLAKATPGPWRGVPSDDYQIEAYAYPRSYTHSFKSDDTGSALAVFGNRPADFGEANRDLVVAAVNALPHLLSEIERLTAERDAARAYAVRLETEVEDLRAVPWPQWAIDCLKLVRDESGYDGYDDADGVDLPDELSELINELRHQADKNVAEARASRKLDEAERGAEHYRVKSTTLRADLAAAREALERLERANDEVARCTTRERYLTDLADIQPALLDLDDARTAARKALSTGNQEGGA